MDALVAKLGLGNIEIFLDNLLHDCHLCGPCIFIGRVAGHEVSVVRNDGWVILSEHVSNHSLTPLILLLAHSKVLEVSEAVTKCLNPKREQEVLHFLVFCDAQNLLKDADRLLRALLSLLKWRRAPL